MNLSKPLELVMVREAWHAAVQRVGHNLVTKTNNQLRFRNTISRFLLFSFEYKVVPNSQPPNSQCLCVLFVQVFQNLALKVRPPKFRLNPPRLSYGEDFCVLRDSLVAQLVKRLPAKPET